MQKKLKHLRRRVNRTRVKQAKRFHRLRRHPVILPVLFFVGLTLVATGLFLWLNHGTPKFRPNTSYIVILSHDHETQTVPTNERTVGDLLDKLDIPIHKNDRVEPSSSTRIVQDNLRVNIYRALPVTVVDNGKRSTIYSAGATPRSIIANTGVPLYAEDTVMAAPATNLLAQTSLGEEVTIERATPVTIVLYGNVLPVRTHAATVGELLASKNIKLGSKDTLTPAANTPVSADMQILVVRKGTQIVTETQNIPAPVQTITDHSLSFGTSAIRQQGAAGKEVLTYQINTQNGKEVSRTLLQKVVTQQPVPQIIARGQAVSIPADKQAVMAQAGISSNDYPYADYIVSHESGWCPTKLQGQIGYCPGYPPQSFPSYLGYGVVQATPGTKMGSAGADWATNPVTQLRWATSYAVGRYGSWGGAYDHWQRYHYW
jgi:uncharacterized protein YabE (DUF348 family)